MSNLLNSLRAANRDTPGIPAKQSCSAHAFLEGCASDKGFLQATISADSHGRDPD